MQIEVEFSDLNLLIVLVWGLGFEHCLWNEYILASISRRISIGFWSLGLKWYSLVQFVLVFVFVLFYSLYLLYIQAMFCGNLKNGNEMRPEKFS